MNRDKWSIAFIIMLGSIPLLWWKPGYIFAKGDYFPLWLNPQRVFNDDVYLWSPQNVGNPSMMSSFILNGLIWFILKTIRFDAGFIQIIFQFFFFMGSGLFMYHLSKTIYPKLILSPLFSSSFYMFNFFVLKSRLNLGFTWTYTLIPLLITLLIKVTDFTIQKNNLKTNEYVIFFCITLVTTFSLANVNLANIVIILLVLAIIFFYSLILYRKLIRPLFLSLMKIVALSLLLNIWWVAPALNYYLWSSTTLHPNVNVISWSWTHQRASFLNLFLLNGGWDWRPEYYPYYDSYSNPVLIVLNFVPFLLAASALLFRSRKSHFNAYLILAILAFIFLAKGLHEPFSQVNLFLYTYIPGMTMFREPTSKFTMAIMPFLALLIGHSADHIAKAKIGKIKPTNKTKTTITVFFIAIFIIAAYPLVTNPIETKTKQLPFSSYIQIPNYWYEATNWLNNQPGDYKILITPPDDFYQMPYTWGYYGTDQFSERLFQKPTISNYYKYSYKINPDTAQTLEHIQHTIMYNKTAEFKALLDLLNVKYILQRNDIQHNFSGRHIIPPDEMKAFLTQQPYIHLAKQSGQLDIYEYTAPKPYIYILDNTTLQKIAIKIENKSIDYDVWGFTSQADVQEWQGYTPKNQFGSEQILSHDGGTLKVELWNSTWGWKTINSPPIPVRYGDSYQIRIDIKGQNVHRAHINIIELDKNNNLLTSNYVAFINDGTFNWINNTFTFEPTKNTTKYIQIQILHGHETDKPFPNTLWIDNVKIQASSMILNTTGLDLLFRNTTQEQPAKILSYQKINPTKITVFVNVTKPFTLVVCEALDESWTAHTDSKRYEPETIYLGIKGFKINETGSMKITIEYEPQKLFYVSCAISLATFLGCSTYFSIGWTSNKSIFEKIKRIFEKKFSSAKYELT